MGGESSTCSDLRQTKEEVISVGLGFRMERETESLIVAAQNQSIRTNLVKGKIDKSQGDSLCRACRK